MEELVLLCVLCGFVYVPAAIVAGKQPDMTGGQKFGWFLYGAALWPVALVHALILRRPVPAPVQHDGDDAVARLAALDAMRARGVISDAEFEVMKKPILRAAEQKK